MPQLHIHAYVCIYICVCVCMYLCIRIHIYIYIYIVYLHISLSLFTALHPQLGNIMGLDPRQHVNGGFQSACEAQLAGREGPHVLLLGVLSPAALELTAQRQRRSVDANGVLYVDFNRRPSVCVFIKLLNATVGVWLQSAPLPALVHFLWVHWKIQCFPQKTLSPKIQPNSYKTCFGETPKGR